MSTLNLSLSRSKYVVWLWLFGISSFRINGVFVLPRFATVIYDILDYWNKNNQKYTTPTNRLTNYSNIFFFSGKLVHSPAILQF